MNKLKSLLLIVTITFTTVAFSQTDPFNANTGKALAMEAYEKGYNIKAGIGYESFLVQEGNLSFFDKIAYTPNTLSYYISFTTSDRWMETNVYLNYEIQFGKRSYNATPVRTDTVNLLNCTSWDYYFFSVPFQLSFRNAIGKNAYWAVNPGVYFDYRAAASTSLKNGSLSRTARHTSIYGEQDFRPLDFGLDIGFEFGVRAAYLGLTYKVGLKNLAPETSENLTIRNNGTFNIFLGYRFGTDIGMQDAKKTNKIIPN